MGASFIRKGEQCVVDGKVICEAKNDIAQFSAMEVSDFHWFIAPPKPGAAITDIPGFSDWIARSGGTDEK